MRLTHAYRVRGVETVDAVDSAPPPTDGPIPAPDPVYPLTLDSPCRDLAAGTWCGRLLLWSIMTIAHYQPLIDAGFKAPPDLPLLRAFCTEGASGLPLSHLTIHTEGALTEQFLQNRILVAVNDGLFAALPAPIRAATLAAAAFALARKWG